MTNPDVVLSEDPQIHLKHLKPLPAADELVDKCIECGFCEPVCPSKGLTLSPRQRIVIWRDIQAKKRAGVDTTELEAAYHYQGIDTCAATGRLPACAAQGSLDRRREVAAAGPSPVADGDCATIDAAPCQGAQRTQDPVPERIPSSDPATRRETCGPRA